MTQLNDTVQLHNLPLMITLGIDKNDPTRNVVKAYKAKGGASGAATPTTSVQQQAGAAAGGTAPWARS